MRLQKDVVRPIEVDQDLELKKRLRENIFRQTQGRRTKMTWLYRGVAACLLIVLWTLAFYLNQSPNHKMLVTGPGEQVEVRLPDSSGVYLNSNSRLSYPKKFAGGIRSVHLEGEAFFEIQKVKNKRFTVTSPGPAEINLSTYMGISQVRQQGRPQMMNAQEFASYQRDRIVQGVKRIECREARESRFPIEYQNLESIGEGTNWYDLILRDAVMQNYPLSIQQASDKSQFY